MDFIEFLKVLVLGIVEGITEWLPISSTGHMILVEQFVKLNVSDAFMEMFRVVIQLGAIMAVVVLYFNKLWPFTTPKKGWVKKDTWSLWFKVIVAVLPALVIGLPFDDILDKYLYKPSVVGITLILYGILFIIIENRNKTRKFTVNSFDELTYKHALIIGMFQVLALVPGTSRYISAEFSFYLAIPVMFGASLLKIIKFGLDFTGTEITVLLTGMISAFVVSIIAIKFFMGYIKTKDFKAFGYYRIVLGIIVILYFIIK